MPLTRSADYAQFDEELGELLAVPCELLVSGELVAFFGGKELQRRSLELFLQDRSVLVRAGDPRELRNPVAVRFEDCVGWVLVEPPEQFAALPHVESQTGSSCLGDQLGGPPVTEALAQL